MDRDIIMQALKLVIMVATALITTYLIPWIKSHITRTESLLLMNTQGQRWSHR